MQKELQVLTVGYNTIFLYLLHCSTKGGTCFKRLSIDSENVK